MKSIKKKFRPSIVEGKEGGNRIVRQLNTDYRKIRYILYISFGKKVKETDLYDVPEM